MKVLCIIIGIILIVLLAIFSVCACILSSRISKDEEDIAIHQQCKELGWLDE